MARGMGTPESRELAFGVYARFGGKNIPGILRTLRDEHGLRMSMQTLYAWKRDGQWDKRLDGRPPTFEERTLIKIMALIEKLEQGLARGRDVSPQEVYAYTSMVNTFFNISKKVRPRTGYDAEEWQRKALEILENDYGIKRRKEDDWQSRPAIAKPA